MQDEDFFPLREHQVQWGIDEVRQTTNQESTEHG